MFWIELFPAVFLLFSFFFAVYSRKSAFIFGLAKKDHQLLKYSIVYTERGKGKKKRIRRYSNTWLAIATTQLGRFI